MMMFDFDDLLGGVAEEEAQHRDVAQDGDLRAPCPIARSDIRPPMTTVCWSLQTTGVLAVRLEVAGPRPLKFGEARSEISSSTSRRIMLCSLTLGMSFIRSDTSSRLHRRRAAGRRGRPPPCCPGSPPPKPPRKPPGNGRRWPTEISPSWLLVMSRCGVDSTLTSLFFCRSLMKAPNDGMSTWVPKRRLVVASSAGPKTRARQPDQVAGQRRRAQGLAGVEAAQDHALLAARCSVGTPPW